MSDETDEEIRKRLIERFWWFKNGTHPLQMVAGNSVPFSTGRPKNDWYNDLVDYVEEQKLQGKSINEACRMYADMMGKSFGDDVIRARYNELVHGYPCDEFCIAVLYGDIDRSIELYKRLSRSTREEFGLM
jgi:hypothetical protein